MLTAVIKNNNVINVIQGQSPEEWETPDGCSLVPVPDDVELIGDEIKFVDGVFVADFKPASSALDVKAECVNRRKVAVGLSPDDPVSQLDYLRQNGVEEAMELTDILQDRQWTPDEAARAQQLRDFRSKLKAITKRSNEIQELNPIPDPTQVKLWDTTKPLAEILQG